MVANLHALHQGSRCMNKLRGIGFLLAVVSIIAIVGHYAVAQTDVDLLDMHGSISSRSLSARLRPLSVDSLTAEEFHDLRALREGQKVMRDLYAVWQGRWKTPLFGNFAAAEQTHMDAMLRLLMRHQMNDPVVSKPLGAFKDSTFVRLFDHSSTSAAKSLNDCYLVACSLEEADILSLDTCLLHSKAADLRLVFSVLQQASAMHLATLRSHLRRLKVELRTMNISAQRLDSLRKKSP